MRNFRQFFALVWLSLTTIVSANSSASAHDQIPTSLKFPLQCARYYTNRPLDPKELTIILERLPNSMIRLSSYRDGKLADVYSDLEIIGRYQNGYVGINSKTQMLLSLKVDEHTGRGIFYDSFGVDVQCHKIGSSESLN